MHNASIGAAIARWRAASTLRLWLLIAYNVASACRRSPLRLQRLGVWMSAEAFRQRCGPPEQRADDVRPER